MEVAIQNSIKSRRVSDPKNIIKTGRPAIRSKMYSEMWPHIIHLPHHPGSVCIESTKVMTFWATLGKSFGPPKK